MAARETPSRKKIVARVMHEFRHGELRRTDNAAVTNSRQAIAVALSEAGASDRVDEATGRRNLRRTQDRERRGATARDVRQGTASRAALYAEARRRRIPGRSTMTGADLQRALLNGPSPSGGA